MSSKYESKLFYARKWLSKHSVCDALELSWLSDHVVTLSSDLSVLEAAQVLTLQLFTLQLLKQFFEV